ncbi:hypothetical protein [Flavobacterium rhizosphaerae]
MTKRFLILLCMVAATAFAQQKPVQTSIDSTKIKIGSQANLTLKATVDTAAVVNFPEGKNFGQLEVLESYPVDTLNRKGAIYELVKKYGLTQFDSGRYVIPRLPVTINNKIIQTDSLLLEVANIKVDTLKQKMYDIKPIAKADNSSKWLWLYIVLGILVVGAIAFGIWWYLKKRKAAPKKEAVKYASPIEKAATQLQNLEKKELLQKGEVKEYYSEMADIARMYIEEAIHIPAMESTTGQLIEALHSATQRRRMKLSPETMEQLEKVLRTADMVKFAKTRPLDFEIAEDRSRIEKTIVVIDRSIPEEKEEDDIHTQLWLEKQRKAKERRRKRIVMWSSIAGMLLVIIVLGATIGKQYLEDKFFGHPTKELLNGTWVKSEYGNPPVIIETPKVLKRIDAEKALPKEAMALLKDMNMFGYGSLFDNFYVMVSTLHYNQQTEVNLEGAADGMIKTWEAQGAQNILLKTEEFATQNGVQGLRTYGTMTMPDPVTKKPQRMYYELFFFKQQGGLQQVVLVQKEGDEYGTQILERIKNSIELKSLNQQ